MERKKNSEKNEIRNNIWKCQFIKRTEKKKDEPDVGIALNIDQSATTLTFA